MIARVATALALVGVVAPARAWDSMCVRAEGLVDFSSEAGTPVCVPLYQRLPRVQVGGVFDFCSSGGYETAQGVYGGEHALITARLFRELGLEHYAETEELEVAIWSEDASFEHHGVYPYLTPAPFSLEQPLRKRMRPYTVAGFAELPDFGSSLADWASGYEHCAIFNIPRDTVAQVQTCHEFTEVLGPVNSNHFVPQARGVFEHYQRLAKEVLGECKRLSDRIEGWTYAERSRTLADEVLAECETEGMTLLAIGLHYLEDVFSVGHMWERWGTPRVPAASALGDAKAVAALSGVIHGWRTLVEPFLVDWYADTGGSVLGAVSQDPLSAPYDESSSNYREGGGQFRGVGDDYVLPCLQTYQDPTLPTLFATHDAANVADFGEQFEAQERCVAAAILDAYRAGPMLQGEPAVPGFMEGVAPNHHLSESCFGRRATNAEMYRALGVGSWSVSPAHLAVLEIVIGARGVAGQVLLSVPAVRQWRNLLTSLSGAFYANAIIEPDGTSSAELDVGPGLREVFGFQKNSGHLAEAVPEQADKGPVAQWSADAEGGCQSDASCVAPLVCNHATALCETPEAATLRAFNRAHATYWCEHTTREDLDRLREKCAKDGERCELCTELARRHVRNACDLERWEALPEAERVDALCTATQLGGYEPEILYAGGVEYCENPFRDAEAAARRWCETEDLTTIEAPDPELPADRLEPTSAGGLVPPPVAPGETVTLEVRYRDPGLQPLAGETIRFARYLDATFESCTGQLDGVARVTDPDGVATFDVPTSPGQPETVYVRACPTEDATKPCDPCDPTTLLFEVATKGGRFLTKVAGDGQIGAPSSVLPIALTVEVSPPVPDGTKIEFTTPDVGLPPAERARLDGFAQVFEIEKPTTNSRAEVRLTLPAREGNVDVTATGVDPGLFPDAADGAVEFRVEARATPVLASLRFAYYQNSPIGAMDVHLEVVRDGVTTGHDVSVSAHGVATNVLDLAPVGSALTVTFTGTNEHGVKFHSLPIAIDFLLERHDLGNVFMWADRGYVTVHLREPLAGTTPPDRKLVMFDRWEAWPPVEIQGAPATVSLGTDAGFEVPFQDFVTDAGVPKLRRQLDLFFYAPGNEAGAQDWIATMSDDAYLSVTDIEPRVASNPPPSEAFVEAHILYGDRADTIIDAPLKVYDPEGTLIFEIAATHLSGDPHFFPVASDDPTVVTGGDNPGGYAMFAANGDEFPASQHGLLFIVVDPPVEGYVRRQRHFCTHDRGNVQRILVENPASCVTLSDCRIPGHGTSVCRFGQCYDFKWNEIHARDARCSNSAQPAVVERCWYEFQCGPGLRCAAGECVP